MTTTVYIATSLDGFIARPDGGLDWLPTGGSEDDGEDYGYRAFVDSVDVLVMGRNTFETVLSFGEWPYGGKPVVVLTSRTLEISDELAGTVEAMSAPPGEVVRRLAERGATHLYIDGGKTIQRFLAEGLIQRLIITRVSVLLGSGIPLFGPLPHDIELQHVETRPFASGLVQSHYEVGG